MLRWDFSSCGVAGERTWSEPVGDVSPRGRICAFVESLLVQIATCGAINVFWERTRDVFCAWWVRTLLPDVSLEALIK